MLLATCTFTNVSNGAAFDFLGASCRTQKFEPSYSGRIVDRPRMQMHGSNPTVPYIERLPIHQEGLLIGDSDVDLMEQRGEFLKAALGALGRRKTLAKSGTLTVEYPHWGETASFDVAVEAAEAPLDKDGVRTCNYQVTWIAFTPYAVGDASGDTHYL